MNIQFGSKRTPFAVLHIFFLSFVLFGIIWLNGTLQQRLGASQRSVVDARQLNVTHIIDYFYCELPYNDCLCTVLWNTSNTSETCITYDQLAASRILPPVLYALEIYLFRALFTLHTAHRRIIIPFLWIASVFMFIVVIIGFFWTNCLQTYVTVILVWIGVLLLLLIFRNQEIHCNDEASDDNRNKNTTVHPSDRPNEVMRF
jgi:hypothetical protein